jgi:ABC-type lipoprotein release transport system permease subunit
MIPLCGSADPADIGVKLYKPQHKKQTLQQISRILGDDWVLQTSEEINKGYFAALKLEKVMIVFLFMIIFLMVSINTFGALKLMLAEKKKDISILKALGTTPDDITTIYTIESIVIGFIGCMIGVILGYFIAFNIANIFHVVEFVINAVLGYIQYLLEFVVPGIYFPNVVIYDTSIYYQSSFIIKLDFWETFFISFIVVVMTIVSAFVPVYHSSKLKPNEVLKS